MAKTQLHLLAYLAPCLALSLSACAKDEVDSTSPDDALAASPPDAPGVPDDGSASPGNSRKPKGSTGSAINPIVKRGQVKKVIPKREIRNEGGVDEGSGEVRRPRRPGGGETSPAPLDENGLLGEVFAIGDETSLPDFAALGQAAGTIDIGALDFEDGFPEVDGEGFALRFTGSFNVVDAAEYQLCLNSADGSQLFLEDELVVDNDGVHGPQLVCEPVYLEAGEYGLAVHYFKGGSNGAVLQFLWATGDDEPSVVPVDVLYRPGS